MIKRNGRKQNHTVNWGLNAFLCSLVIAGFLFFGVYFHRGPVAIVAIDDASSAQQDSISKSEERSEYLFHAIDQNDVWAVRDFFLRNPHPEKLRDQQGHTLLHRAVLNQELAMVKVLLEEGAKIDDVNQRQQSPLSLAQDHHDDVMMRFLLEQGANVRFVDATQETLLHKAIEQARLETVTLLLEFDHHPKISHAMWEAALGQPSQQMEHLLLDADLDAQSRENYFQVLVNQWQELKTRWLLSDQSVSTMHFFAGMGNPQFLQEQLDQGGSLVDWNQHGEQPFHEAIRNDFSLENAQWFLGKVDLNQATKKGYTPVLLASQLGHYQWVRWLLDHGARLDDQTPEGKTALDVAQYRHHTKTAELLKQEGALRHL